MFFRLLPWEYAIRNLFRRPLRTSLTFAGLTTVISIGIDRRWFHPRPGTISCGQR